MKKKFLAILLMATMALSLAACGGGSDSKKEEKATTTESSEEKKEETQTEPKEEPEAVIAPYEADLEPGAYYIGLHIPEGIYNIQVISGLGNIMTTSGITSALGSGSAAQYADSYSNATLKNGDILKLTQSLKVTITTQEAYFSTMSSYENPATEEKELSPGSYVVGQDVPAGLYDISVVTGTANAQLDDFSFNAMLTDNETLAEAASTFYKNLELLEGRTLQVSSGTVKLTPTPNIEPIAP